MSSVLSSEDTKCQWEQPTPALTISSSRPLPTTLLITWFSCSRWEEGNFHSSSKKLAQDRVLIGWRQSKDQWPKFSTNVDHSNRYHLLLYFLPLPTLLLYYYIYIVLLCHCVTLPLYLFWIMQFDFEMNLPMICQDDTLVLILYPIPSI